MDRALTSYLKRYSTYIEWDISFLTLTKPDQIRMPSGLSYYLSRKHSAAYADGRLSNPFGSNLAIVLQGPIMSENSLTMRIVNYYATKFPEVCIVISTWKDTPSSDLAPFLELEEKGRIRLVQNDDPEIPGALNVNRQIVSSRNGLFSVLHDHEFAIKSRTDQVFMAPRFLHYLGDLLDRYSNVISGETKIVISSLNTFAFRLYSASDMFHFGKTKDLYNYWNQPLDFRDAIELSNISSNLHTEALKRVAEVYLNTNYFTSKVSKDPSYDLKESLHFIAQHFIIADAFSLGQKWFKNTNLSDRWGLSKFPNKFYELNHSDWIGLQSDTKIWEEYSELVNSESFYRDE
jgi:hypothetical protein